MSATVMPRYPSTVQRTKAQVGVFGELWSRAFVLTMLGGGVMGAPLTLCFSWSQGSTPNLGAALGVMFAGIVIGAVVGVFVGLSVAIAGVLVLRRRPAVWQVYRFAHGAGVVVSCGMAVLIQSGAEMRPVHFGVYFAVAGVVGWWLSPRLVHWYVDRIDRGLR